MSPEYLIKGDGIELMDSLVQNKLIGFLAIDEAHCISVWGHDFRPEYMKIKSLREKYPQVPILAVTATATNKVAEEISVNLNLNKPSVILANFDRPNLYLKCINYGEYKQNTKIKEKKPRRKKGELSPEKDLTDISDEIDIELLKPYFEKYKNDKIIIYTNSRSTTVNLSDVINKIYKERISESYHAGMSKSLREQVQAKFANGDINIMVSTIAFGMGVDFVIRCVIIIGGSSSIEEYWQQIGRAGRDNLDAETIVFFQPQTIIVARSLIDKEYNKNSLIGLNKKNNLNSMQKYFYLSSCRRKFVLNHFNQPPKFFTCNKCDNCCEKELIDITSIIWSKEFNTKHPSHLENFQVEYIKEKLKPFQKNRSDMDSFYELKSDLINWKKYIIKKEFTYDTLPFNLRIRISLPNLPNKIVSKDSIDKCEKMLLL
jgi:hypothetical protein